MSDQIENVIIIGTGAAGLTAAIYAARANMNPLVLAGLQPGGQLTITTDVENYPGFADVVQGPWLMQQMQEQAENVGARIDYDLVASVDFSARPFVLHSDGGKTYRAKSVIIATGAQARWLGLESETTYKDVAVVGGGNTAVEEALYLANICKSVTLIHRRDSLRAEQIMQDRLMKTDNIKLLWNRTVEEVTGEEGMGGGVTGLTLASTIGEDPISIAVDGMFVAIGHDPATSAFKGAVSMDDEGYILA
ncbi:MAG: FAD-binding protein, partial [Alphaproteobacteria bacterium]|nr:FAD-binding protein [Alphaproteobacteria bacterium]